MDGLIEEEISKKRTKKALRAGVVDILLPANKEEYQALNKMAILVVALFSQKETDLPAYKYFVQKKKGDELIVLPRIFPKLSVKETPEGSNLRNLGKYRQDIFLFIPVKLLKEPGKLLVRFDTGKELFPLAAFPIKLNQEFILKDKTGQEDPMRLPDPMAVASILKQNYCF